MSKKKDWLPFEEAREIVRKLKIKSYSMYRKIYKENKIPNNIPIQPHTVYKKSGWISFGDWLGTGRIADQLKVFLNYEEAKKHIHKLNIKSSSEFRKLYNLNKIILSIPKAPDQKYKNSGWISWGDFLGTNIVAAQIISKNYLSYEEAKKYVHKLNIQTPREWKQYIKSGKKPSYIPSDPYQTYGKQVFVSMRDWLNSSNTRNFKRNYLDFNEARQFIHTLQLKTQKEWFKYCKSGKKPENIPYNPSITYKDKGYISFPDWLGTKLGLNEFLNYDEAKKLLSTFRIASESEWRKFSKSNKLPNSIPAAPSNYYKNKGWISWGDFLGTNVIKNGNIEYVNFNECKKYIQSQKITTWSQWKKFCKLNKKPNNIPYDLRRIYKNNGWISSDDLFSINSTFHTNFLSFEEARTFVRKLNLRSVKEWQEYSKEKRPPYIPGIPGRVYKNKGWISYGDWLGTGKIAAKYIVFVSFEDAKRLVHTLNLSNQIEWHQYCKSGNKPQNIPQKPYRTYKNKWTSWADFLGLFNRNKVNQWNRITILSFLTSIRETLEYCSIPILISLLESNGPYKALNRISESFKKLKTTKPGTKERTETIDGVIQDIKTHSDEEIEKVNNEQSKESEIVKDEELKMIVNAIPENLNQDKKTLSESVIKELKGLDIEFVTNSLDNIRVEFIQSFLINNFWYYCINKKLDVDKIKKQVFKEPLPKQTVDKFINELAEVQKIKLPVGYKLPFEPNLMQKLIVYRLGQQNRYGNWSDVGTGKTLSAILASRYYKLKNVLIITFNSTIGSEDTHGWIKQIKDAYPNSKCFTKENGSIILPDNSYNYYIVNYESFQQETSPKFYKDLLKKNKFDFVILDEVHSIKHRDPKKELSKRREVVLGTLTELEKRNKNFKLLAMSATPVINSLVEARAILEVVTGEVLSDLNTKHTIQNCVEMFRRFTLHGIRYKTEEHNILKREKIINIDITKQLFKWGKIETVLDWEKMVMAQKLKAILPYIDKSKGKTILYTHYIGQQLEKDITDFLDKHGFTVGVYTGPSNKISREDSLSKFMNGKYDVLLGSIPIGTGIDGLQKVSDRGIMLSLPWTMAEKKQIQARINRQGSKFKKTGVDWIIPLCSSELEIIGYDTRRWNLINYKGLVADAAIDGDIPEKDLPPLKELQKHTLEELNKFIERIKQGNILTEKREKLIVELIVNDIEHKNEKKYGDWSALNQKWSISNSTNTHNRLSNDRIEWDYYHSLYRESRKSWSEIPYQKIAKKIRRKEWLIADLGCGENLLRFELDNKIEAFDHVAIDDSVTACDISNIPVKKDRYDAVVLSLALMGSNYKDYLKEAHRVLKYDSRVYIAEPLSKWEGRIEELVKLLENIGFQCLKPEIGQKFFYVEGVKK